MEFLGHIGIDLKMVAAQAVNFLILVVILRWALYRPMMKVFRDRKLALEKLQNDLSLIEKKKQESEAAYRAKLLDAEGRANEIVLHGKKTLDAFSDISLAKNREYLDGMLRETKERIDGAKSELGKLNKEAVRDGAFDLAAQFLTGSMRREIHEKLANTALENFEELGAHEEDIAFKGAVSIDSPYPLSRAHLGHIARITRKKFGKKIPLEVSIEPGIKAGLIIRWGGYQLDGSLRGALAGYADKS